MSQAGEYVAMFLGAGNHHVQTPFSSFFVQRTEILIDPPHFVAPVADADKNDITLVTLYVFQVLYEKWLLQVGCEKLFAGIVLSAQCLHPVFNGLRLGLAECRHAKGKSGVVGGVFHHGAGHGFGFHWVGAAAPPVVHSIRQMVILQAVAFQPGVGTGKNHQTVVVELPIGYGNERLMATAVMPAQRAGRSALAIEQVENALYALYRVLFLLVINVIVGLHQAVKEAGRRQLLAVTYYHRFLTPQKGAESIHGSHLAGFVEHHQVELQHCQEPGNWQWTKGSS